MHSDDKTNGGSGGTVVPAVAVAAPYTASPNAPPVQETEQGPETGAWQGGICAWYSQCVPTCFAAAFCDFCLTARFFDQYVKRKSYWIVLSVLLILVGLEYAFLQTLYNNVTVAYAKRPVTPGQPSFVYTYIMYDRGARVVGYILLFVAVHVLAFARSAMRQRYSIPGNLGDDIIKSLCCRCCVLAQMYRHVRSRNGQEQKVCEDLDCAGLGPAGV